MLTGTLVVRNISTPFKAFGAAAIIAAGFIAAAIAYHSTEHLVWMIAYLVLVVGVVQYVLGAGQERLADKKPSGLAIGGQWLVLNLGNAGVIGGTLLGSFVAVVIGTVLFAAAMVWFLWCTRGGATGWLRRGYRVLALFMLASSLVGLVVSFVAP